MSARLGGGAARTPGPRVGVDEGGDALERRRREHQQQVEERTVAIVVLEPPDELAGDARPEAQPDERPGAIRAGPPDRTTVAEQPPAEMRARPGDLRLCSTPPGNRQTWRHLVKIELLGQTALFRRAPVIATATLPDKPALGPIRRASNETHSCFGRSSTDVTPTREAGKSRE